MHCERCRTALSALLDGEDTGVEGGAVDAHLAGCAACRAYERRLADLHRLTRVRQAEAVPDLSAAILARVAPNANPHDPVLGWLRSGLVFIGVLLVGISTALLLANDLANPAHLAAWDLAFGGALLFAAVQPDRARGLLPMAVLLVASMSFASVVEINEGHDPTHGLVFHVAELTGVVLLALLARHRRPARRSTAGLPAT
jgi:predicted anti-sigma-YlaC factor YlaD